MISFETIPSLHFLMKWQKRRIFKIASLIYTLSLKVKREGIFSLEETDEDFNNYIDKCDVKIMQRCVWEIIDNTNNRELYESHMKNFVNASDGSKLSKLCHQMIASGVCAINEGIFEQRILEHLASFLNESLREDYFNSPELRPALMETGYIIVNDGNDFLYPEDGKISDSHPFAFFLNYQSKEIHSFLRSIDGKELAISLFDAPAKIRNVFLKNMSEKARFLLKKDIDEYSRYGGYAKEDIKTVQEKLVFVANRIKS